MAGINLNGIVDPNLDDSSIMLILKSFGCEKQNITNSYQKWRYQNYNLTITRFDNKISIQGKENDESIKLIKALFDSKLLKFDRKNENKLKKLYRFSHNAILCPECHNSSIMLIEAMMNGSNLVFNKECGHKCDMKPPIFMHNTRILPDISVLVSHTLSRCIRLGFFEGFEIVIPTFIMDIIDALCGKNEKKGVSNELSQLRELEIENRISIYNCRYGKPIPNDKNELEIKEDNFILGLSNLTNSILFTLDRNLKDKAILAKRPTVYMDPKLEKPIKDLFYKLDN